LSGDITRELNLGLDKMKIRQYKTSDKDDVIDLHKLALEKTGAWIESGKWDEDLQNIEEVYLKNGEFLVLEDEGKIIAMGAIRKISDDVVELKRMRVHPKFQRKGIGQKMLISLENRARELGFKKIVLNTTEKQKQAVALYLKNGYRETKKEILDSIKTRLIYFEKEI